MKKQYHIAFAADVDFQIPLALALYSLERVVTQPERYCVHILHQDIDTTLYSSIGLDLRFYNVANALKNLPTAKRFPTPIYYRFLLADILPPDIEKVLYLDCDIMVTRDISGLWDIPLEGAVLAACPWVVFGSYASEYKPFVDEFPARLGVSQQLPPEYYYYSSFLMMDIALMRAENISSQLVDASLELPAEKLLWPDQDVLNYVLRDRMISLPLACNVIPLFATEMQDESEEARAAYAEPIIIHFAATKPNILTGAKLPYEKEFFTMWRQSPWSRSIPYPLVSLRKLPTLLKSMVELPIKLAIKHDGLLHLYGRLLSLIRPS